MTTETFVTDAGVEVSAVTTDQMREVDRVAIEDGWSQPLSADGECRPEPRSHIYDHIRLGLTAADQDGSWIRGIERFQDILHLALLQVGHAGLAHS